MAKFDGGKYKDGILSYNYLGGEGGEGKGGVFIKQFKGKWHFVDEDGKVRTDVGIKGKLTPTHIQNLKDDNIFAAADIDEYGEVVSDDIDSREIRIPSGGESDTPLADRSNLSLRDAKGTTAPSLSSPDKRGSIDYKKTLEKRGTVPAPAPALVSKSPYDKGMIGSGYSENTSYALPNKVSLPDQTMASSPQASYGVSEFQDKQGGGWEEYNPDAPNSHLAVYDNSGYTFPTGEGAGQMSLRSDPNRIAGDFGSAEGVQKLNTQNTIENMKGPGGYSNFEVAASPYVDSSTKGLTIGKRGYEKGYGFEVDDDFYRTKDGTLMKDGGWFSGDTAATQADINAGIKDQASPGMTSAEGWQAAGSVMKGIGGLASAYTGMKNYQLARDAHNAQKNQWQANYTQQLKAFEQNKDLANQDIASRNRTLKARNKDRTDLYKKLS